MRIIVADADGKNAGLLAFGFEREGMAPVVAHAAADVSALLASGDIDAIVLSLGSTGLLTNAVNALRGLPGTKDLPILALGDASARIAVLAAGASEYLARPAYVRDVVCLVRLLAVTRAARPAVLSGELGEFSSVLYLLRALCETRRSGVITIECAGRRAELVICDGTISTAQLGRAQGVDALRRLSLWQQGRMEVRLQPVSRSAQIGLELTALIESLGHFVRAAYELAPEAAGNALFAKDVRKVTEQGASLNPSTASVLRDHDGRKRLWEVVADCAADGVEAIAQTRRLLELGLLMLGRGAKSKLEGPGTLASSDWMIGTAEPVSAPVLVGYGDVHEPSGNLPRIRPTPVPPEALGEDPGPAPTAASGEITTAPMLAPPSPAWKLAASTPAQAVAGELGTQRAPDPRHARTPDRAPSVEVAVVLPPPVPPEETEHTDPDAPLIEISHHLGDEGTAVSGQVMAQQPRRPTDEAPVASIIPAVIVRQEEPAVIVDPALRAHRQSQPPPPATSILGAPPVHPPAVAGPPPAQPAPPGQRPSNPDLMAQVQKTADDAQRAASRALAFDAQDEKFFRDGLALAHQPPPKLENFDDLDAPGADKTEEQPAPGFWKKK
jgi:DNA-binding response OmpR family regulator